MCPRRPRISRRSPRGHRRTGLRSGPRSSCWRPVHQLSPGTCACGPSGRRRLRLRPYRERLPGFRLLGLAKLRDWPFRQWLTIARDPGELGAGDEKSSGVSGLLARLCGLFRFKPPTPVKRRPDDGSAAPTGARVPVPGAGTGRTTPRSWQPARRSGLRHTDPPIRAVKRRGRITRRYESYVKLVA